MAGKHRAKKTERRQTEAYVWFGTGAITLGLGVALAAGSGVAQADTTGSTVNGPLVSPSPGNSAATTSIRTTLSAHSVHTSTHSSTPVDAGVGRSRIVRTTESAVPQSSRADTGDNDATGDSTLTSNQVIGIADTVLLVLMPGSGDSIQALKAGIMEIPDVIAVNKRDHPAAKTMMNEVRSILALDTERDWKPPIVLTEAVTGEGVPELWEKIVEHRAHLEESGTLAERRAANLAGEVFAVASARATARLEAAVAEDEELRRLLGEVQRRELDPLTAVREIMERVFKV